MSYRTLVHEIAALPWSRLSQSELLKLMLLMHAAAVEFAESLRIARQLYPDHEGLREMAEGELQTTNLQYEDYTGPGDHADFLAHFIKKYGVREMIGEDLVLYEHIDQYLQRVRQLPDHIRAMSIFSRESELHKILVWILTASDWSLPALGALRYYIVKHNELDTAEAAEGGHAALIADQPVTEEVKVFWWLRRELYRGIPELNT